MTNEQLDELERKLSVNLDYGYHKDALEAIRALRVSDKPTHRHLKRGSLYRVIAAGKVQTKEPLNDYDEVIVYEGSHNDVWVRPVTEFTDGRFERIIDEE